MGLPKLLIELTLVPAGTTLEYHGQHFTQQEAYEGHSNIVRPTVG